MKKRFKKQLKSILACSLAVSMLSGTMIVSHGQETVDISNGLLAYYDFEACSGTATPVPNLAGDAYEGTIFGTNMSITTNDYFNKSLHFGDGLDGYMQIPSIINVGASSYSLSMWYKYDTDFNPGNKKTILFQQSGSGRTLLSLTGDRRYSSYVNAQDINSNKTVDVSQWQHVTFVYNTDTNKIKYYINGELDCEKDAVNPANEINALTDLLIGRHKNGGNDPLPMRGDVDEIRVYNRVLTDAEAKAVYADKASALLLPQLHSVQSEAQDLYDSEKLSATSVEALALHAALTESEKLTAASSLDSIQSAIYELQECMKKYRASVGHTLSIDLNHVEREIDSSIFGINHRYAFNGYGTFDTNAWKVKDDFRTLYENSGFGSIRYPGGTISNLFNWKETLGSKKTRKKQIHGFYNNPGQGGIAPNFGIGEIATFADSVDSEIVYVYSLGRGNAQDAADLIEYLNAKVGTNPNGGIDWAQVRADNGHEEPYHVRYFEIGNEMQQAWSGSDGTASQGYWTTSVTEGAEKAYTEGGTASFTKQYAVCEEDWNKTGSQTDGKANMVRYMRYANINPKKYDTDGKTIINDPEFTAVNKTGIEVWVGTDNSNTQWTIVENFDNSLATDKHVVIDYSTGAIHFGDGTHGKVPDAGQNVYVTYSVNRQGFIDISKAMKETTAAINVAEGSSYTANVYTSYESTGFINRMANLNANEWYDGMTIHPYSGTPSGGNDANAWYDSAMSKAEITGIGRVKEYVNMLPEGKVPVISEYGIFRDTNPQVRSQTHALYIAKVLMEYVRLGSPYIQKHCLVDWYSSGGDSLGPTQQAVIQAVPQTGADTKTGEGDFAFFATPSAHVFQMLNSSFGTQIVSGEFDSVEKLANGTDAYSALVSKDDAGNIYAAIINIDRENAKKVTLSVKDTDLTDREISIQTLAGDSITAENTLKNPTNVTIEKDAFINETSTLSLLLPAHAFVVVKIAAEVPVCTHENTEVRDAKAPTCTEAGYTGDTYCKDCQALIEAGEVINPLGHALGEWKVIKEATKTEDGLKERTCTREGCIYKETEILPKLPSESADTDTDDREDPNESESEAPNTGTLDSPKTGDTSSVTVWFLLMAIACTVLTLRKRTIK